MGMLRRLGGRLARTQFAAEAVAERADLSPFRARPSLRLLVGVSLIGLSYPLGWPLVGLLAGLAVYWEEPLVGVVGGPLAYGFSWVVWIAGSWLAGTESAYYGRVFARWAVRRTVERLAPDAVPPVEPSSPAGTGGPLQSESPADPERSPAEPAERTD